MREEEADRNNTSKRDGTLKGRRGRGFPSTPGGEFIKSERGKGGERVKEEGKGREGVPL